MSKIAVVLADLFEDSEYTVPVERFNDAGHRIIVVGLKAGETVRGKKDGTPVAVEKSFEDVSPGDFDALLIPGGYSPDKLRAYEEAVAFVSNFMKTGKPVFSICHGPQILITADVLRGRRITGWKSIKQDIRNAGAEFEDSEVVVDGNLVSSRQPSDLPAFVRASLEKLQV